MSKVEEYLEACRLLKTRAGEMDEMSNRIRGAWRWFDGWREAALNELAGEPGIPLEVQCLPPTQMALVLAYGNLTEALHKVRTAWENIPEGCRFGLNTPAWVIGGSK